MLQYDRRALGNHLKAIRKQANLTQSDVSKRLGYSSPQFISNLERGVAVAPIHLLAKMTRLYKSNPEVMAKIILTSQEALLLAKLKAGAKRKG